MSKKPEGSSLPPSKKHQVSTYSYDLESHGSDGNPGPARGSFLAQQDPKRRVSYLDSVGELRSDYTIGSDGLMHPRPEIKEEPMTSPVAGPSAAAAGKAKATSPPAIGAPAPDIHMLEVDDSEESGRPVKIDGDVYFTGKPDELPILWLHMFEKASLDTHMDTDRKRCAYLATRFRGAPRDWLVQQHTTNAMVFTDYAAMCAMINDKYARLDKVQQAMDSKMLDSLRQTTTTARDPMCFSWQMTRSCRALR